MKYFLTILLSLLYFNSLFAQKEHYLKQQKEIKILIDSAEVFVWSSPDISLSFSKKAEKKAKQIHFIEGIVFSLKFQSSAYYIQGLTDKALKKGIEAIEICEKEKFYKGLPSIANNLGLIYQDLHKYKKSIFYFNKAIKYGKKNGKPIDVPLNNKANSFYFMKNYKQSILFHKQALEIREANHDSSGIADCKNDIGIIFIDLKQYKLAYKNIYDCYKIKEAIHETEGIAFSSIDMANLLVSEKKPEQAIKYIDRCFEMAKIMNSPRYKELSYEMYAKAYNLLKNYKKAYQYQVLYSKLKDSLRSNESIKQIAEMQTKYETEKTEQELKLKNVQYEKQKIESKRKTTQRNFIFVGLLLVIILVIIILRSYKIKQKANILLEKQKQQISEKNEELNQQNEEIIAQRDEIEKQKKIVEEIYYEVSESINYAKRLQQAVLPEEKLLEKYISDHFIFFKPKDKVSGDFYWWAHVENHTVITVADCTGHGVPGAFMSMLGASFLREIVQKEYITHTGVILRKLRKEIIKALKQTGESGEQKDGMDMAIISIDHETNVVQYSGANNPLYIIKSVIASEQRERSNLSKDNSSLREAKLRGNLPNNDEIATPPQAARNDALILVMTNNEFCLYEVKPDKMPIAIYERMEKFTTHEIQIEKGDQLYMFSDGFADQFGGPTPGGKKFKYKPFKRLLLENANKPMKEQKEILEKIFTEWKGNNEQVDDVTVVGIKI